MKSKPKTCELDPVPTCLVKEHIDLLLPLLCQIIHKSLSNGIFPAEFRCAIVKPILKKSTLNPDVLKHYRPVSNLGFLSKIIEKCVLTRLNEHISKNHLENPLQSAYKLYNSMETALLKITNDIYRSIDAQKCVFLILLGLSAAFDTLDINDLLETLRVEVGLRDTVYS
ncbi:hypothetical protein SNE40_022045 [Patella caerulea]|uniref:Reverse transcriptase domain-containing protein n=1 Tax=Patella caerulea TaxID=87958 RepID=A0AAN8GJF9_PATCE